MLKKMQLRRKVPYIGHLLTSEELQPDPKKVRALGEIPRLKNIQGVQHLIGMANYMSKCRANLPDACEPLSVLTHNDTAWRCSDSQQ